MIWLLWFIIGVTTLLTCVLLRQKEESSQTVTQAAKSISVSQTTPKPKIIDGFMFYNEFEILDLRLHTLENVVDEFVLVYSNRKHKTGEPYSIDTSHPLFQNEKFTIHIVEADMSSLEGAWERENAHRNAVGDFMKEHYHDEDVIMISDVDEIPNPSTVISKCTHLDDHGAWGFMQVMYYYNFHTKHNDLWRGTLMMKNKLLHDHSAQSFRNSENISGVFDNGGWHLSYFGGLERIKIKMDSIVEGQDIDEDVLKNRIEHNVDLFGRGHVVMSYVDHPVDIPPLSEKITPQFF